MNTYLIISETIYFINEKIMELSKDIDNIITFNMNENTIEEILEEASYFSMFDDSKCIIVKNSSFLSASKGETNKNKEIQDKVLKYLENENKNTLLIFINDKLDSKKKICNVLKEYGNIFVYNNLTKTEIKNKLKEIVINNKYKIDDNTLWFIINNNLGNFDLCINELNKIMIYYSKPCEILYNDVLNLSSKVLEDNNFKLVDAIIKRDISESLKYLNELKILKIDPSIIISLLYREFKLMLSVLIYEKNKCSKRDILSNLRLLDWQYDKVYNNLRNYNINEINIEINKLANIDYLYKSGKIDKDVILVNYIMDICS